MTRRAPSRAAIYGVTVLAALATGAGAPRTASAEPPSRVVSLNLCADELLLRLARPEQIASVTFLSRDPKQSTVADLARDHPVNYGRAEDVLRFDPDLVVAGRYTTRTTVDFLRRNGETLLELDAPATLPQVEEQIRRLGEALGEPDRAQALADEIAAAFAEGDPIDDVARPTAVVFAPNGFTVGAGSLVDTIIYAAGLRNLGAEQDLGSYRHLPLERLLALAPDVLILAATESAPARAYEVLHHPILRRLPSQPVIVRLSPRLWTCAGPEIARALSILRGAAAEARERET